MTLERVRRNPAREQRSFQILPPMETLSTGRDLETAEQEVEPGG
jgi:hypothetical protein